MQALDYSSVRSHLAATEPDANRAFIRNELPRLLSDLWCQAYTTVFPHSEIVSIELKTFKYLFDLSTERNVAVFGTMAGENAADRDRGRMKGYPKAEGHEYHRGHMIPHAGHGGTDINLFIQLGSVNVGPFRVLEKLALANPGSFYFVRLLYQRDSQSQRPIFVEQGLIRCGPKPVLDVSVFAN